MKQLRRPRPAASVRVAARSHFRIRVAVRGLRLTRCVRVVLMVNIQDEEEFASHQLNRDTWANSTVKDIVKVRGQQTAQNHESLKHIH